MLFGKKVHEVLGHISADAINFEEILILFILLAALSSQQHLCKPILIRGINLGQCFRRCLSNLTNTKGINEAI